MMDKINLFKNLDDNYKLTQEQINFYQINGHIHLKEVCSVNDCNVLRKSLDPIVKAKREVEGQLKKRDTYGKAFLQMINLWRVDEHIERFVFAKRFAKIAADLSKVNGVRLYHDQALFKEGGGGFTPWHQDQHYWPLDTNQAITMWMPLIDITEEMATLYFASGSQRKGYLGNNKISDDSESYFNKIIKKENYKLVKTPGMKAGEATFHNGWVLHGAPGNKTDIMREIMTIIYFPDGTILTNPDHEMRKNDLKSYFPGQKPGEVGASKLNPILYCKS
jgi:ectoine hydroxylase-related dioxygenase (phytanoyl-CoA dioxygenase family)